MRARTLLIIAGVLVGSAAVGAYGTWLWLQHTTQVEPPIAAAVEPAPETVASPGRRSLGGTQPAVAAEQPSTQKDAELTSLNTRAIAALDAKDFDLAIELFEKCVKLDAAEPVFAHNLSEALARKAIAEHELQHPCAECLELMTRAQELAPDRDDIRAILARWKREADLEKDFWRESSTHFELAYDGDREDILESGNRILNTLEDAYGDFVRFFGSAPIEEGRPRISVTLYRRDGFSELTGLNDWAGGAFDGTVRIPVGDFAREGPFLERIMRHELAHAFVREVGGTSVPGWFNEGIAQWLEPELASNLEAARARVKGAEFFPIERLKGTLATWKNADEVGRAYAQSLLIVDWVEKRYGDRVLLDVLAECKSKTPPETSIEKFTHVPLASLIEDLVRTL